VLDLDSQDACNSAACCLSAVSVSGGSACTYEKWERKAYYPRNFPLIQHTPFLWNTSTYDSSIKNDDWWLLMDIYYKIIKQYHSLHLRLTRWRGNNKSAGSAGYLTLRLLQSTESLRAIRHLALVNCSMSTFGFSYSQYWCRGREGAPSLYW
jgi:hypothetical protein